MFGLFKKKKYENLKREEVVNSIIQLEAELKRTEAAIPNDQKQIDELMEKGRHEKNKNTQLLYAKKITMLKNEQQDMTQRCMYLMYNIQLLNRLKKAIDDNQFFKKTSQMSLGNLLSDQKGLAKFLNQTLNTRVSSEDVLTSADQTFQEINSVYTPNAAIYGESEEDNSLLAMFETENQLDAEREFAEQETVTHQTTSNLEE